MSSNKSQASVEFVLVFSLAFLILLPILYVFHNYTVTANEQMATNMINILGNDIVSYAESTFYMGKPARLTMEGVVPEHVENITIISDWDNSVNEIVFKMNDGQELGFFSEVNINGTIDPEDITAGQKEIMFEAMNNSEYDYVNITIR